MLNGSVRGLSLELSAKNQHFVKSVKYELGSGKSTDSKTTPIEPSCCQKKVNMIMLGAKICVLQTNVQISGNLQKTDPKL